MNIIKLSMNIIKCVMNLHREGSYGLRAIYWAPFSGEGGERGSSDRGSYHENTRVYP